MPGYCAVPSAGQSSTWPRNWLNSQLILGRCNTMRAAMVILKPIGHGWVVALTNGRELARFTGPGARWRAIRYIDGRGFSHGL
jgi:hypothetical protein